MKRSFRTIVSAGIVALIAILGLIGYRYVRELSKPSERENVKAVINVRTERVKAGSIEQVITLTGEIKAISYVEIKPKISGRLERLALDDGTPVIEGTQVQAGQVLAVLEHKDLEAAMAHARAAVTTAQAAVSAAQVDLKDKEREKVRMENLAREGSATEKQRDAAAADYDRAVAGLEQSKAGLAQAEAAAQLAAVTLDEAFLKAPMTAVVCEKRVDPGAMVGPTTAIVSLMPMDELKFLVAIPAEYLPRIVPGKTDLEIRTDTYPDRLFPSRISNIYPTVDPVTRTATVEIMIQNSPDEKRGAGHYLLQPGMYATARIVLERKDNAIIVPADSLIRHLDSYRVFVAEGGVARAKPVVTGIRSGERQEIVSGLAEGDELVVSGQHKLTDGTAIERIAAPAASEGK